MVALPAIGASLVLALASAVGGQERREFAVDVAADAADAAACPSAAQLREALEARMPGIVPGAATPPAATVLGLTLSPASAGSARLALTDAAGAVVLERVLARAAADCAVLADTVGLIVERYLREIGYRGQAAASEPLVAVRPAPAAPPPPPAAPRRELLLGVGAKVGAPVRGAGGNSQWTGYLDVSVDLHLSLLVFSSSVGVGTPTETPAIPMTDGGTFRLLPMPLRLGVGVHLDTRAGSFVPALGGGADVLGPARAASRGPRRAWRWNRCWRRGWPTSCRWDAVST